MNTISFIKIKETLLIGLKFSLTTTVMKEPELFGRDDVNTLECVIEYLWA